MAKKSNCAIDSDVYWQSLAYNKRIYAGMRNIIENIALARFRWVNLPDTCDARYLERTLYYKGIATISAPNTLSAKAGKFFSLQCVQQGGPNMYGNPSKWLCLGDNGTEFPADGRVGYYCWDNLTRRPLTNLLDLYARELADIIRTQQIDRMHLKTPYLITAPRGMELTVLNVLKQLMGGEPAIVGNDALSNVDVSVISTNVEFHGAELTASEANVWNKIYTALGIANLTFKAERQIEDEGRAFKAPTDLMALSPLECRRNMCEYLNKRFGLDIRVYWNADYESNNYNALHDVKTVSTLYDDNLANAAESPQEVQ